MAIPVNKRSYILTADNKIAAPVLEIARITGVQHENTLESLVAATQKKWLRSPGFERWQMQNIFQEKSAELMPLFEQLNMCTEIKPSLKKYNYCLVLGSLASTVIKRYEFANALKDIEFDQLVLLTGQRPLLDDEQKLLKTYFPANIICHTEKDMMVALLQLARFSRLKISPLTIVDVAQNKNVHDIISRPTTADTFATWIDLENPAPGSCLAISSQPFVHYQDTVLRTQLPADFKLETVGPNDQLDYSIALYLDTLARWMYQELELQKRLRQKLII